MRLWIMDYADNLVDTPFNEEEELAALDNFEDSVSLTTSLINRLMATKKAFNGANTLKAAIDDLAEHSTTNPDEDYSSPFIKLETRFEELSRLVGDSTIPSGNRKDSKAVPAFDDFITFVAFRADVLTTTPTTTSESKSRIAKAKTEPPARKHQATVHSSASRPSNNTTRPSHSPGFRYECMLCPGSKHPLFVCTVFNQMSIQGRKEHIWSKNLCSNCLAPGHQNRDCRSWASCRQCGGRHHSLIHKERRAQPSVNVITSVINDTLLPVETVPLNCSVVANSNITGLINPSINVISPNRDGPITNPINPITNSLSPPNCLMMTSKVLIKGPGGRQVIARALLDSGSSMTLASTRLAKSAQLHQESKTICFTIPQTSFHRG